MKAVCLLVVLVLAKIATLWGRDLPLSPWALVAYFWQDALVVLIFAALDRGLRLKRLGWGLYAALAIQAALGVPITRILSTPLTWPLLRAAGGPLRDSMARYLTFSAIAWVLGLLGVAVILSRGLRRLRPFPRSAVGGAILFLVIAVGLGPTAVRRVETQGLHRNPMVALAAGLLPRTAGAQTATGHWRESPFPSSTKSEAMPALTATAAGHNVLVVVLESTGAPYLGAYGAEPDPMPTLTALSRQGMTFENASTAYPESIKGLFAVLCSTFPALDLPAERYAAIRPPCLPKILQQAGYHTGLFHSGRFAYLGMEAIVQDRGFETLEDAGAIGGNFHSSFGLDDERTAVRHILSWIDGLHGERFFVEYLPVAGHHPYNTPERGPFPEPDDRGRYRNALHHADQALAELVAGLRARGLERNTVIALYGDHGEAFGQHPGNFAHTLFIYEENLHVPLVLVAPGTALVPQRVRKPVSLVDLAPTLLDLLGLPAPASFQGQSALGTTAPMPLFFTDYSLALLGLRDQNWKAILELESGRTRLFDLEHDPLEQRDLSGQFSARAEAYNQRLRGWSADQRQRLVKGLPPVGAQAR